MKGNWTLCTILFTNVAAGSYISILNSELMGETLALIVSIPIIVVFGEIVPQAISVKYGIAIVGPCLPVLYLMYVLAFPVAFPFAAFLDFIMG